MSTPVMSPTIEISPLESGNPINDPTPPTKSSDLPPAVSEGPPLVLISGAGLAGLFLALLLEKANIPYEIFERAKEVLPLGKKPPHLSHCRAFPKVNYGWQLKQFLYSFLQKKKKGSVMSLSCNILPVFEQLGLYDDLMRISYPCYRSTFLTSDLKKIGEYTADGDKEM